EQASGEQERPDDEDDEPSYETRTIWEPRGTKVGWVDSPYVYFIPEILFAEIDGLAGRIRTPLSFTHIELEKRLAERGVIFRDEQRKRIRIRVTAEGVRVYVLKAYITQLRWLSSFGPDAEQREEWDDMLVA